MAVTNMAALSKMCVCGRINRRRCTVTRRLPTARLTQRCCAYVLGLDRARCAEPSFPRLVQAVPGYGKAVSIPCTTPCVPVGSAPSSPLDAFVSAQDAPTRVSAALVQGLDACIRQVSVAPSSAAAAGQPNDSSAEVGPPIGSGSGAQVVDLPQSLQDCVRCIALCAVSRRLPDLYADQLAERLIGARKTTPAVRTARAACGRGRHRHDHAHTQLLRAACVTPQLEGAVLKLLLWHTASNPYADLDFKRARAMLRDAASVSEATAVPVAAASPTLANLTHMSPRCERWNVAGERSTTRHSRRRDAMVCRRGAQPTADSARRGGARSRTACCPAALC